MGKFLVLLIMVSAVGMGAAIYYLQVYAYYEEVALRPGEDVMMTSAVSGAVVPVPYDNFQAIDSQSSPIRYRACFTTPLDREALIGGYVPVKEPGPTVAPGWFDCFDAVKVGTALEEGRALAFMGTENVKYGIDRIVAIDEDGRGFVWHQINRCGAIVFDGNPAPDDCPQPPGGY